MEDNWNSLAKAMGYASDREMFRKLYVEDGKTIAQLREQFSCTQFAIKKKLIEHGITIRSRGGARSVKIASFTQEMLDEINRDGIRETAKRYGVSRYSLFRHRRMFLERQAAATQSPSSAAGENADQSPEDSHNISQREGPADELALRTKP